MGVPDHYSELDPLWNDLDWYVLLDCEMDTNLLITYVLQGYGPVILHGYASPFPKKSMDFEQLSPYHHIIPFQSYHRITLSAIIC